MKKNILIVSFMLVFLVAACERYINSRDPLRSLPDDVPVPHSITLSINDQSVELSWDITNGGSISKYRIYASEEDTLNFIAVDSTTSTSIEITGLTSNQLHYFEIAAVSSDGFEGYRSERTSVIVGVLNMRIANNEEFTSNRSVQIQFTVSNAARFVMISEDSTFAGSIFEPFSTQRSFTLSEGDGIKTVYARIQFDNGSENGALLRDTIILDTRARIDTLFFEPSGTTFSPGDTITFGMNTGESGGVARVSFNGSGTINLFDDGAEYDPFAGDGIYHGWYVVPVNTNLLNGSVTGNFTDEAGNRAPSVTSFELLNINTVPEAVVLVVQYESGGPASFSWTSSTESDFESYRIYRDTSPSVTENSTIIHYETTSGARTFDYTPPAGTTYYRVFVFDAHGESTGSNVVSISNP